MTDKPKDPRTITLKRVRLSFTDALWEKRAKSKDNPDRKTHHFNIINEASGKYFDENNRKIMDAIRAAGEKEWKNPDAFVAIAEDTPKRVCFRDGSKWKNQEGKVYAGYEGNKAMSVSGPGGGQRRPKLIDRFKATVEETQANIERSFYGGVYADVIVSLYGTNKGGSRGIFATGELIRSWQEGEPMGGGYHFDESDLDELDDLDDGDGIDNLAGPTPAASAVDLL